jgi:hypothetical protein
MKRDKLQKVSLVPEKKHFIPLYLSLKTKNTAAIRHKKAAM